MRVALIALVALAVLSLSACGPRARLSPSFLAADRPVGAAAVAAGDMAQTLAAVYPPGRTSLFLLQTGDPQDDLGQALETALRARGFQLAPDGQGEALTVTYVLDRVDETTWYSKLSVSDGLTVARVYQAAPDGLAPEAATLTGERGHE